MQSKTPPIPILHTGKQTPGRTDPPRTTELMNGRLGWDPGVQGTVQDSRSSCHTHFQERSLLPSPHGQGGQPCFLGTRGQPHQLSLETTEESPPPSGVTQSLLEAFIWAVSEDKRLRRRKREESGPKSAKGSPQPRPCQNTGPEQCPPSATDTPLPTSSHTPFRHHDFLSYPHKTHNTASQHAPATVSPARAPL